MNKILNYHKKTLTYEELSNLYNTLDYYRLVEKVEELVNKGLLAAKLSTGTNGRNPALYKKYGIIKPEEDFTLIINEIKSLNVFFNINYYLNKPKEYIKVRQYVQKLNDYIVYNFNRLSIPMSINERSYEIWGEEKYLRKASSMLSNLGISIEKLNVYNTPEPFFYEIINKSSNNVLIIENKDTWFTLKKYLRENPSNIYGIDIALLIYGEGKKIISSIDYLQHQDFSFLDNPKIYYWGDIDFEGINIFYLLSEEIELKLLTSAYMDMLNKVKDIDNLKEMKEKQNKTKDLEKFLINFSSEYSSKINEILIKNRYIPQEIINYRILMEEN